MRYRDPESRPSNYNPRGQDTRARYRRGNGEQRWEHDGGRGASPGRGGREGRDRGDDRPGGRRWDADRWERAAPTFERATDRWDAGRMGDGASVAKQNDAGALRDRISGEEDKLDYEADERLRAADIERDIARDGGQGRNARAAAWAAARRESPRRSRSPVNSPVRDERSMSPGSDMQLDQD
ncbi:hypothetical protein CC85DRAFT_285509 [Cutaneotrichosporon oleaginosum]|uniref:Uncharacterized protein n=1 Tax=Cutaneotrichosporon oleaginosum TaxID=879819 RepID=A0A0J0XMU3_9TREE|nr:uncharacterized protein CC85DRAFT_285509 [Cutaneotrichosporon oleaginosum]KLT42408.1 hypothetical protein CC85DRAFT_285509 [Cutaneotrichosporon oleaginosum]TXT06927.1 hypothetical protein COLE_06258 [Cutaneotrichosporon oleaginosum]